MMVVLYSKRESIKPLANPDVTGYYPKDNLYRQEAQLTLTNPCDAMLYIIWSDYLRPSYCVFLIFKMAAVRLLGFLFPQFF